MRFAYADPPYIGQAKRHYSHDPQCAEVDHGDLIGMPTLGEILHMIDTVRFRYDGLIAPVRVAVWCKSFCAFKRNVRPAYAWEPVIFLGWPQSNERI